MPLHTVVRLYDQATQMTARPVDQTARSHADLIEARLDRANLIIQTLLMLLMEKQIIHEDEFREWLVYADHLDGVRDGRLRDDPTPIACGACHRTNPRMATKCIYCGQPFEVEFLSRRPNPPSSPGETTR